MFKANVGIQSQNKFLVKNIAVEWFANFIPLTSSFWHTFVATWIACPWSKQRIFQYLRHATISFYTWNKLMNNSLFLENIITVSSTWGLCDRLKSWESRGYSKKQNNKVYFIFYISLYFIFVSNSECCYACVVVNFIDKITSKHFIN